MGRHVKRELRKTEVLDAAIVVAVRDGFNALTRDKVADEACCAVGTINNAYKTMAQLRRAVVRQAVRRLSDSDDYDTQLLGIVAAGLVAQEPAAKKASAEIKQAAAATLI